MQLTLPAALTFALIGNRGNARTGAIYRKSRLTLCAFTHGFDRGFD